MTTTLGGAVRPLGKLKLDDLRAEVVRQKDLWNVRVCDIKDKQRIAENLPTAIILLPPNIVLPLPSASPSTEEGRSLDKPNKAKSAQIIGKL